ncbi:MULTISPECIES: hypothetical protein [Amycolatopsis]|uniref:Uncharacterized protein n=1 Tax=Amycolatopsis albidoflavus TaxID=102226 RepID=A0ABW5HTE9_9PSEU
MPSTARDLAASACAGGSGAGSAYFVGVLLLACATAQLTVDRRVILNLLMINAVLQVLARPRHTGTFRVAVITLLVCALLD